MRILDIHYSCTIRDTDFNFPTDLYIPNAETKVVWEGDTAFGFVYEDGGSILFGGKEFPIYKDMYFSIPGKAEIRNMQGLICIRKEYTGVFSLGGPVEKVGRLKYVDDCSDTLLLSPLLWGDPCLNYLHVPNQIHQIPHTHPSVRIGCILSGKGYCLTDSEAHDLLPGKVFVLPAEEIHSFHTAEDSLRIFVFHPDSDFGPTHDIHPMINRTYIEGVSLRGENQYRTTEIRI